PLAVDSDLKQQEISSLRNRQSDDSEKAAAEQSGWLFYLCKKSTDKLPAHPELISLSDFQPK
ncbi:MAG: hypothetical protein Q8T09_06220, partial [Candidatus Melainabacteria bacterium]|nr:hypothetical protein [Candidatus Melainabacteria bacterium]